MNAPAAAEPDIRVLMTATSYPADATDWQGRFIYDMAGALAGTEQIRLGLWAPKGDLPLGVRSCLAGDDAVWLSRLLAQGGIAHLLRTSLVQGGWAAFGLLRRLRRVYAEFTRSGPSTVAHVNWLQNALPLWDLPLPALVTVLGSDLRLLRLPGMTAALRAVLRGRRVILAPNAGWMTDELATRFGDLAEIRPIPFGVDARWFAVKRDASAPASGDWLVVSRVTRAKLGHLLAWGDGLFGDGRRLHLLGPMQDDLPLPSWINYHGPTHPDALAGEWFSRAAGLLTLSTHDEGRPQIMLEAMAAGLPVVASDLPAHRDLVRDGCNGWLVGSRGALQEMLERLDGGAENRRRGEAARSWVAAEIGTWNDCARRYARAYRDLLA